MQHITKSQSLVLGVLTRSESSMTLYEIRAALRAQNWNPAATLRAMLASGLVERPEPSLDPVTYKATEAGREALSRYTEHVSKPLSSKATGG